jgi:hypothetical protein
MKLFGFSLVVLPLVAVLVGCGNASLDVETHRETIGETGVFRFELDTDAPLSQGKNDFQVSIHDVATNAPVTSAVVELSAIMPAMAHDAPDAPMIEELASGTYLARDVALPMPGRWEVHVHASKTNTQDDAKFVYDIP